MGEASVPLTEKCPLCKRLLVAVETCPGCGDPLGEVMLWCSACNRVFEADSGVSIEVEFSPGWSKLKGLR